MGVLLPIFGLSLSLLSHGCRDEAPASLPPPPAEPAVVEEGWAPDPWDPSRFHSDKEPVLEPSHRRTWGREGLRCPEIAPAGAHRALWVTWWNATGATGLGRALQAGEQWAADPEPALEATQLDGIRRIGCVSWLAEPDGRLRGWVDALDDAGQSAIYALTSPDGRGVRFDPDPVLEPRGPWKGLSLGEPAVVRVGDGFRMYLRCGTPEESTICTATSADGRRWTLHEGSVLYRGRHDKAEHSSSPFAVLEQGRWHLWLGRRHLMWHAGEELHWLSDTGGQVWENPERYDILHASSRDPTRFDVEDKPIVHKSGRRRWDALAVGDPCIERVEGGVVAWIWGAAEAGSGSIGRSFAQEKPTSLTGDDAVLTQRRLAQGDLVLRAHEDGELIEGDGVVHTLRRIPAGSFILGSPLEEKSRGSDELPHEVHISRDFLLGETEVTQALWQAVTGENPSEFQSSHRPVEQVSWDGAIAFCNQLSELLSLAPAYVFTETDGLRYHPEHDGFRLPSEAEWEYAARAGGIHRQYATSGELSAGAWWRDTSGGQTHPVGALTPNAWGLHDMTGNVYEWVWDLKAPYMPTMQIDPLGPIVATEFRVERGGSFRNGKKNIRIANRGRFPHDAQSFNLGLRICRTAPQEAVRGQATEAAAR